MGYSGRYHAASLAAVFIALAIGILIGIGLAGDVVTTTSEELEASLRSDLDEAEARVAELETQLGREQDAGERIYPALVNGRLDRSTVAVIGIGELSRATAEDVQAALEPTGAEVAAVAALSQPVDLDSLAEDLPPRIGSRRGAERARAFGRSVGGDIAGGSALIDDVRGTLFRSFNGNLADVDRVVLLPAAPPELEGDEAELNEAFMTGFFEGVRRGSARTVGAERTDADPSALGPIGAAGIPTVDHVDLIAGKVALVFALLGAEGDYGVREDADSFLPELIESSAQR